MMNYKRGDVVLVPFPFTDLTTIKQRPALIISSGKFNSMQEDAIIVAITSNITERRTKYEYRMTVAEQKEAGLPKTAIVRCGKILTIDQRLIRRKLGLLPDTTITRIVEILDTIIG